MKLSAPKINKAQEMDAEYRFDYSKAKPNRFANRAKDTPLVVMIDTNVVGIKPVNAKKQKKKLKGKTFP